MAKMTVEQLQASLKDPSYTVRTDEQLQSEAQNRYTSTYNQKKLAAQQNYDTTDLAYQQQLKTLQDTLASNQQALAKNTMDSIASADRYTVTRGMQRSSYGAANRASIQNKGNESLAALLKQYSTDAGGIENNRTLLARQLADTLAQYDIDYLNDVQAYIDEQKQVDYERQAAATEAANALQMQLFEYSQKYGKSGGGGGGRRSSSGTTPPPPDDNSDFKSLYDDLNQKETYKTYKLNPSFGTANQTTGKQNAFKRAASKVATAKSNASNMIKYTSKANSAKK